MIVRATDKKVTVVYDGKWEVEPDKKNTWPISPALASYLSCEDEYALPVGMPLVGAESRITEKGYVELTFSYRYIPYYIMEDQHELEREWMKQLSSDVWLPEVLIDIAYQCGLEQEWQEADGENVEKVIQKIEKIIGVTF